MTYVVSLFPSDRNVLCLFQWAWGHVWSDFLHPGVVIKTLNYSLTSWRPDSFAVNIFCAWSTYFFSLLDINNDHPAQGTLLFSPNSPRCPFLHRLGSSNLTLCRVVVQKEVGARLAVRLGWHQEGFIQWCRIENVEELFNPGVTQPLSPTSAQRPTLFPISQHSSTILKKTK